MYKEKSPGLAWTLCALIAQVKINYINNLRQSKSMKNIIGEK
jgi:hypothetical protein